MPAQLKHRLIPLVSDTESRPTAAMRIAIANAEVGDEQREEDPTVNRLQVRVAELLGKEAALWFAGGTMCNFFAVKVHTRSEGLAMHMDGARLLNACVATGVCAAAYASHVDSVWIDFTKGLGAPIGAVMAGSKAFIAESPQSAVAPSGAQQDY